ncbi:hypothetical protein PGT21_020975 [Puccinia graminis f. sp. tritici]|uniref:Uncharacterized protein n=1 Tax=Puccinia graminis f. sp. tritici TaxID=56615 RepID=A0A5B0Q3H1_PUCGR|nr:hypothetical protein PGT21_020975 [Puccinia graminis f. sp. tritici]KAA1124552.1 hypothetical protein PGTUg99_014670 [Puccinia graminis f. sp. tritici]
MGLPSDGTMQVVWCCKPVWALAQVGRKRGQVGLADPKPHVAPSKPNLAYTQAWLGTSQSWGGSGQSLAWPSPSESATQAKTNEWCWLVSGVVVGSGFVVGGSGEPRAWVRPSQTWACAKIRATRELPTQAPWAMAQAPVTLGHAGLGPVPRLACNTIYPISRGSSVQSGPSGCRWNEVNFNRVVLSGQSVPPLMALSRLDILTRIRLGVHHPQHDFILPPSQT